MVATTASGAKPSLRKASKPTCVQWRATASTAGSDAMVLSISRRDDETAGRRPGGPNASDTIASERTLASALTMGVKCGPRRSIQFSCSCPPRTTSMSGMAVTNSASCARLRWVSATIASTLPCSFAISSCAAGIASRYLTHGFFVALSVTPIRPIRIVRPLAVTGTIDRCRHAGEGLAVGVGDVGGDDPERRLGEMRAERGLGHVKLVIAEGRPIEVRGVEHLHHLAARQRLAIHERRAEGGRRQVVAAKRRQHGPAAVAQLLEHGGHPRQPARLPALDGQDLVHVVQVDEGDGDGRRRGLCPQRGNAHGGQRRQQQQGTSSHRGLRGYCPTGSSTSKGSPEESPSGIFAMTAFTSSWCSTSSARSSSNSARTSASCT